MICNERQYRITCKQIETLSAAISTLPAEKAIGWLEKAQISALQSQVTDLEAQVTEYSLLKEGKIHYSVNSDLSSLPKVLIQARISKGLSQQEFADSLNISPQQVQRYEASNYMGASLARLIAVSKLLGVSITESWSGKDSTTGSSLFVWNDEESIQWNEFPIKEMIKRGWLKVSNAVSPEALVKEYFFRAAGPQYATALHRKKYHGGNSPNKYSLLAWQARVIEKAKNILISHEVAEFEYDDSFIKDLVKLSEEKISPIKAKRYLESKGIILVVEEHLPGTYLDGAAMLLETGHPVVALTLRHDRLDNFWFVLMHEIGHVFLHLFESLNMDFFDEEESGVDDELEKEADEFALNALIPNEVWELCLSRFSITRETVLADASNLGIHPSIIAGRIRRERNSYKILPDLVGQGEVRSLFGEFS